MNSRKKPRLVLSVISTGLLFIVCTSSQAARSVRSDSSDANFDFQGAFWGTDNEWEFGEPGVAGRTEFKLKIGPNAAARFFTVCMSEEGFLKLIASDQTCADSDYDLPPTGNYIAVFATELDGASAGGLLRRTRGFVDSNAPYKLWQADPAMRFWWNFVTLAGDTVNTFDVQVVLIDRSNGTNNGNFDIELNYGSAGGEQVPPEAVEADPNANGFQGFKLGPNSRGPTFGPFGPFTENGAPIRFCFRDGKLRATCN